MEFHQLEYFLAVTKFKSFSRAADEIKISQSSLSQQISKLEEELGVTLFSRTTRSVQLTLVGMEFAEYAQQILSALADAQQCINDYLSVEKTQLSLGVLPVIKQYHCSGLLASFQQAYPGIELNTLEERRSELFRLLASGKIDAAIVQYTDPDPGFRFHNLFTEQLAAVTGICHVLASQESVSLSELQHEQFIIPPIDSGHFPNFSFACQTAGFQPQVLLRSSSVDTILGLVREEIGISVLSSCVIKKDCEVGLAIIPLTPPITDHIAVVLRQDADVSRQLNVFLNFAYRWANSRIS